MLKNKLKIIAVLTVLILTFSLPIVKAENVTSDDGTTPISDNLETNVTTNEDNLKKGDVYLTGDYVNVDYIVDGNLFIFANHVTINSQIGGDAFIFANTVTVEKQGYIFSNLFTFSKNVNIYGVVYDLYAASENTTIDGFIHRDVHIGSDTVNISGTIKRNAHINCSSLNFTTNSDDNPTEEETTPTTKARIDGNLTYSAKAEISVPEGAVTGETTFKQLASSDSNIVEKTIMSLITFVVTIIAVWLVCSWLAPNFLKATPALLTTKKVLPVIAFGILTPIIGIFLTIVFFIMGITSTLALLLLMMVFSLIIISTSIFTITLNTIICNKLKIEKRAAIFCMLVGISMILWLIGLIPFIGPLLGLIVVILGLGIVVSSLVLKNKEKIKK